MECGRYISFVYGLSWNVSSGTTSSAACIWKVKLMRISNPKHADITRNATEREKQTFEMMCMRIKEEAKTQY
jgi:hypothetical protein